MGCSSGLWGYFPAIQPTGSPRKNRESFQQNRAPDGAFSVSARGNGGRFQMRPGCVKPRCGVGCSCILFRRNAP